MQTEITGITNYQDDFPNVAQSPDQPEHSRAPSAYSIQPWKDFLSRPVLVSSNEIGSKAGSPSPGISFYTGRVPHLWLTNPAIWAIMRTHRFWRFNLVLTIRVTSTRMHSGNLLYSYFPSVDNGFSSAHLNAVTGCVVPHTIVNVTEGGVGTLTCKMFLPLNFFDLYAYRTSVSPNSHYWGLLVGFILNEINHPDSIPITINLFAHAEEVCADGPTGDVGPYGSPPDFNLAPRIPFTAMEQLCDTIWPASAGEDPVDCVSQGLPNQVDLDGSTKSINTTAENPVVVRTPWMLAKGSTAADPMTLFSTASLKPTTMCSRHSDEMSIKYISSIMAPIAYGYVPKTAVYGADVITVSCHPFEAMTSPNTKTGYTQTGVVFETPLGHLAKMFSAWRGSLNYRLVVSASSFHACRLAIAWAPFGIGSNRFTGPSAATAGNFPTKYVDVNGPTTVDFSVPYCSTREFLNMSGPHSYDCCNGALYIYVVNPLRYQLNGTQIDCLLFAGAGSDFVMTNFTRPLPIYPCDKVATNVDYEDLIDCDLQGGPIDPAVDSEQLGSFEPIAPSQSLVFRHGLVAPELPVSVLELGSKPLITTFLNLPTTNNTATTDCTSACAYLRPWRAPSVSTLGAGSPASHTAVSMVCSNPVFYIMVTYAFWRGSFDFHVVERKPRIDNSSNQTMGPRSCVGRTALPPGPFAADSKDSLYTRYTSLFPYKESSFALETAVNASLSLQSPHSISIPDSQHVHIVSLPYFSTTPFSACQNYYKKTMVEISTNNIDGDEQVLHISPINLMSDTDDSLSTRVTVAHSFGHDFQLACYVGPPSIFMDYAAYRTIVPNSTLFVLPF
ncbi:putative capsid protein [Freshwater macrophyte associated picorna-like virus 1]|nr:putative capsid protein [Freshwater macrophyte associated picorna-like virus 1]